MAFVTRYDLLGYHRSCKWRRRPGGPVGVLARRAEAKSDSEEFTAFRKLVRRPLRIILGPHNLPVAHVNDSIPVLRRFRIVRDHQYRLPHFLVRPP